MAGGNVCAYAQQRGIAGFVVDGVIRDLAETRKNKFPVFGLGVIPIPGVRKTAGLINVAVVCGGRDGGARRRGDRRRGGDRRAAEGAGGRHARQGPGALQEGRGDDASSSG